MNRYSQRGVETDKKDVYRAIARMDKGLFPDAFCKIVPDLLTGDEDYCMVVHADGAGTKSSLAYLYWRETGDLSVWKGIAQDALVMNIDDLLCVGAVNNILVSTTIGRNRRLIPGEVIREIIGGVEEFIDNMRKFGIRMKSTGGETADVGDLVRTIIVDATAVCRMKRKDVIVNRILPEDVIIGLASSGKAIYEKEFNSGIGSNGLTSARHDMLDKIYRKKYPESYDPALSKKLAYCGKRKVDGHKFEPGTGKLLLSPTRTYAPLMKEIIERFGRKIHGIIHCTGGGQTKVLKFIHNLHLFKDNLFPPPLIFDIIGEGSGTSRKEMYKVFNMGHRMEIYINEKYSDEIIRIADRFNIQASVIGRAAKARGKKLTISNHTGKYVYS